MFILQLYKNFITNLETDLYPVKKQAGHIAIAWAKDFPCHKSFFLIHFERENPLDLDYIWFKIRS